MPHRKWIAIIESCANCPRAQYNRDYHNFYCFELHRDIKPSKHTPGADYYHVIPDDCPLPIVKEE